MTYINREHSVVLVLFGHSSDPAMDTALEAVKPFAVNMVVDVAKVPELGQKYNIRAPTLMKIYKAHVVRIYTNQFTRPFVKQFVFATSTWRASSQAPQ